MLFNFKLTPLEFIQPWGKPGDCSLHWFGLTDGQYWIEAGADTLFEHSQHAQTTLGLSRCCNYYIARLYEDIVEMAPYVLEPVPSSLIQYLSGDQGRAWDEIAAPSYYGGGELLDEEQFWEIAGRSSAWIGNRNLDNTYLSPSTKIRMWSDQSLTRTPCVRIVVPLPELNSRH